MRGCPMHDRVFSSIPGLYQLDASHNPSHDKQKCLLTLPDVPWEAKLLPGLKTLVLTSCLQQNKYNFQLCDTIVELTVIKLELHFYSNSWLELS